MPVFDPGDDLGTDLAYRLMINTSVTLFWRQGLLDATTDWLVAHGYQIVRFATAHWVTPADMHRDVAAALGFPDYYGHNLNALNDCMRDVVDQRYGWQPGATGLVLVFVGFDAFTARHPDTAQAMLDIVAGRSRDALLVGRRLFALVHSDDPQIRFESVGAVPVDWNGAEWLDANRRMDTG
jgi:RNAse (barnase) inhibitor barstar